MSLAEKYEKSLRDRWCMRFKTSIGDNDYYDGVVTHIKRKFIVIRVMGELRFDGVNILPKKMITGFRDSKHERCINSILRELGTIKDAKAPRWLETCDTLADVIAQLNRRDIWPAIEAHWNSEAGFYLGPIVRADSKSFEIHTYSSTAEWDEVEELEYVELCRIEFDDTYSNDFNAYMRKKNPAKRNS